MVAWDETSFMGMKLVYTISNIRKSWKHSHETPTNALLFVDAYQCPCLGVKTFMIVFIYVVFYVKYIQERHVAFYFHSICSSHIFCRFLKEEWSYLNVNTASEECPLRETVWKNLPRKVEKKRIEVIPCSLRNAFFSWETGWEAP